MTRRRDTVTLAHGSGGRAMRRLIEEHLRPAFDNPLLAPLQDQARIDPAPWLEAGARLAFTTDSFVVDPPDFPGGNIGTLAVNGTVNDLAVGGARPLYLSCALILEEGLPLDDLERYIGAMREAAAAAGVTIVTGDTKVVPRGAADGIFVNTAGIGVIPPGIDLDDRRIRAGDVIVVSGHVGDHGAAIADARGELALQHDIRSDCRPLHRLVEAMLAASPEIRCMRDATRGGLATVLNEFAAASGTAMHIREQAVPIRDEVRGLCEILGLDPLYLANEGMLVAVVSAAAADDVLNAMQDREEGRHAAIVGEVAAEPAGTVILHTGFGGERVLDLLVGDQLPRIC